MVKRAVRIYLVRHGQTDWNVAGKMQGHANTPLNAVGREQAERVGAAFRSVELDRLVSSDTLRAHETAEAISRTTGVAIECDPRLRERSFGAWEGMPYGELVIRSREVAAAEGVTYFDVRPPGGESLTDLWHRILPVVAELDLACERVALVLHGGSCATMLAQLIRGNQETVRSFRFSNASVTSLERRVGEGLYVILRLDDVSHLLL